MKVSQYISRYVSEGKTNESLAKICVDMFIEVGTVAKSRNVTNDIELMRIITEINGKWKAFASTVGDGVREEGFIDFIKHQIPEYEEIAKRAEMMRKK